MIKDLKVLLEGNCIAKVLLDNNTEKVILWDGLINYLSSNYYFGSRSYNEEYEDKDGKDKYYNEYWEEIEVAYQGQFLTVRLYDNLRQDGIITVWDSTNEKWCYVAEANNNLYAILILKEEEIVLYYCYDSYYKSQEAHKLYVGSFTKNQDELVQLEFVWRKIDFFNLNQYLITDFSKILSVDSDSRKERGESGIFYSNISKKCYFHYQGNVALFDLEYLKQYLNSKYDDKVDTYSGLYVFTWADMGAHGDATVFPISDVDELEKVNGAIDIVYREEEIDLGIMSFYEFIQTYGSDYDVDEILENYEEYNEDLRLKRLLIKIENNNYNLSYYAYRQYEDLLSSMFIDGFLCGSFDNFYDDGDYQDIICQISDFERFHAFNCDFNKIDRRYDSCTDGEYVFYIRIDKNREGQIFKKDNDGNSDICLYDTGAMYLSYFNGRIYYCDANDFSKIYSIKKDGTEEGLFCDCSAAFIQAYNGWIYFCNRSDKRKLYRISIEGTNLECLSDDKIIDTTFDYKIQLHLLVQEDWVYYQDENEVIWRFNINNKEK